MATLYMVCPACRTDDFDVLTNTGRKAKRALLNGKVRCLNCKKVTPIHKLTLIINLVKQK